MGEREEAEAEEEQEEMEKVADPAPPPPVPREPVRPKVSAPWPTRLPGGEAAAPRSRRSRWDEAPPPPQGISAPTPQRRRDVDLQEELRRWLANPPVDVRHEARSRVAAWPDPVPAETLRVGISRMGRRVARKPMLGSAPRAPPAGRHPVPRHRRERQLHGPAFVEGVGWMR